VNETHGISCRIPTHAAGFSCMLSQESSTNKDPVQLKMFDCLPYKEKKKEGYIGKILYSVAEYQARGYLVAEYCTRARSYLVAEYRT